MLMTMFVINSRSIAVLKTPARDILPYLTISSVSGVVRKKQVASDVYFRLIKHEYIALA